MRLYSEDVSFVHQNETESNRDILLEHHSVLSTSFNRQLLWQQWVKYENVSVNRYSKEENVFINWFEI